LACHSCLVRSSLLGRLGGHIETAVENARGRRARDLLALGDRDLIEALAGPEAIDGLREAAVAGVGEIESGLSRCGGWATCPHEDDYPRSLADLGDAAPRALLGRGDRSRLSSLAVEPAVAVVGARKATAYGLEVAGALGRDLAVAGLAVISGLAYGVDGASHRGALDGRGFTVAVLGGGPDVPSPVAHRDLYRRVIERGLVLSEMPPGSRPFKWSFPARNRMIAALAGMTVVVEAAERSGSLITAEMASDLSRMIGAVPGPVTAGLSRGTNALLADGAAVVRGAQDVLDRLLGVGVVRIERARPVLEPGQEAALAAVEAGAATPDRIAAAAGLDAIGAATALARLELLGLLRADSTGRYSRAA
jgi:DNA processing protein